MHGTHGPAGVPTLHPANARAAKLELFFQPNPLGSGGPAPKLQRSARPGTCHGCGAHAQVSGQSLAGVQGPLPLAKASTACALRPGAGCGQAPVRGWHAQQQAGLGWRSAPPQPAGWVGRPHLHWSTGGGGAKRPPRRCAAASVAGCERRKPGAACSGAACRSAARLSGGPPWVGRGLDLGRWAAGRRDTAAGAPRRAAACCQPGGCHLPLAAGWGQLVGGGAWKGGPVQRA